MDAIRSLESIGMVVIGPDFIRKFSVLNNENRDIITQKLTNIFINYIFPSFETEEKFENYRQASSEEQVKYLKSLVEEIQKENCNIAIGSRFVKAKKPHSLRMLGSRLLTAAIFMTTGKKIKDPTSGMRAYNAKAIEAFVKNASLTPEPDTLVYMLKKKMTIKEVEVQMKDREFGESYLKPLKAMEYMINMFLSIIFIRAITRKN